MIRFRECMRRGATTEPSNPFPHVANPGAGNGRERRKPSAPAGNITSFSACEVEPKIVRAYIVDNTSQKEDENGRKTRRTGD